MPNVTERVVGISIDPRAWGARGKFLLLVPLSVLTGALDTIAGLGAGVLTIVSGGMHQPSAHFAYKHLRGSKEMVARTYVSLSKTLNPSFKLTSHFAGGISSEGNGLLTGYIQDKLVNCARNFRGSNNRLVKHVFSRATYFFAALSSLVTRVIDLAIGIIAAPLSFLTYGKFDTINNVAFRGLQVTGVFQDLVFYLTKTVNPWAQF